MEPTPGIKTSEFLVTAVLLILGSILDGAGIVLNALQESGTVQAGWLPVALVAAGTGLMLVKALGYTRSRTMVKLAAQQPALTEVLKISTPLALEVARILREDPSLVGLMRRPPPASPAP